MQTYNIYQHNELQDGQIEDLQERVKALEEARLALGWREKNKPESELPLVLNWDTMQLMPDDLCEAVEQCKLSIIRHRSDGWHQVSRETMLQVFNALAMMVKKPIDPA